MLWEQLAASRSARGGTIIISGPARVWVQSDSSNHSILQRQVQQKKKYFASAGQLGCGSGLERQRAKMTGLCLPVWNRCVE